MTVDRSPSFELAQLNIGRLLAPVAAPEIAAFVELLGPINALAESSPGFRWRLIGEGDDATDIQLFDDDLIIVNMSVWASLEELRAFAYDSRHVDVLRRRREWFERHVEAHLVLWWVPLGHRPTTAEAIERLEHLRANGPTADAFTFRAPFGPPDAALPERSAPAARCRRRVLLARGGRRLTLAPLTAGRDRLAARAFDTFAQRRLYLQCHVD